MSERDYPNIIQHSRSIPDPAANELLRDSPIETLKVMLEGPVDTLVVEGAEATGKTTLLAQFARRYADRSIALFLRRTSRWSYHPDTLAVDLQSQLAVATGEAPVDWDSPPDPKVIRRLLFKLNRVARERRTPYYFILDGLFEIPEDAHLRESLIDSLPFGYPGNAFVI